MFVSYAHSERALVERLAGALRTKGVTLWFDGWEMQPGDVLRERIIEGIAQADFFLALISPASLKSNWVRYELNLGMASAIEQGNVTVISALAPGATREDLPTDLRGKECLDFTSNEAFRQSVLQLVDLVHPELRLRCELTAELRHPDISNPRVVATYRKYLRGDQSLTLAAISGLEKIPGTEAVLLLAEVIFAKGGARVTERTCRALARRHEDGGVLALCASLLVDEYNHFEKARGIAFGLERMARSASGQQMDPSHFDIRNALSRKPLSAIVQDLELSPIDDVRFGVILSRMSDRRPAWAAGVSNADESAKRQAIEYADSRLPGLSSLILRQAD